jgi:hypothetical protein
MAASDYPLGLYAAFGFVGLSCFSEGVFRMVKRKANKLAIGNAGIAPQPQLAIERHWPGVPEL